MTMADLATLETQLEALKNARRSGVQSAGYGDKRTEFVPMKKCRPPSPRSKAR